MLKDTPEFGNLNAVIASNMTLASFIFKRVSARIMNFQ